MVIMMFIIISSSSILIIIIIIIIISIVSVIMFIVSIIMIIGIMIPRGRARPGYATSQSCDVYSLYQHLYRVIQFKQHNIPARPCAPHAEINKPNILQAPFDVEITVRNILEALLSREFAKGGLVKGGLAIQT